MEETEQTHAFEDAHILMIEDNPSDVILVQHALKAHNISNRLAVVGDGAEALDYLFRRADHIHAPRPDIIFLDLNLPKIQGLEVLETIKKDEQLSQIPVFIFVGSAVEKNIMEKKHTLANGYIVKPLDIHKICDLIKENSYLGLTITKSIEQKDEAVDWEENYQNLAKEFEHFVYVISHDLNAPLRQINGFTQILMEEIGDELSKDQQLYRDMIQHAFEQAESSFNILLEYSRLNTDKKKFEQLSPTPLIDDALKSLDKKIQESRAKIHILNMPETIRADKIIFTKAIYHLLDNAIKFKAEGRPLEIKISAEEDGNYTQFCIHDNGIGIPEEQQKIALTILRKLHTDEKYPGAGGGLTFAKKIAELHGGTLWIESDGKTGTTICFSLRNEDFPA